MLKKWLRVGVAAATMAAASMMGFAPAASAGGMTQVSGVGLPDLNGYCVEHPADITMIVTGDLEGCWYITVDDFRWHPSGAYQESGTELFVGSFNGEDGTFATTYIFRGKYATPEDYSVEIHGRCQHPIVAGSGTGVFEGASGRFQFKDDVEAFEFPYTGHIALD